MDPTTNLIFEQVGLAFFQGQLIQVEGVRATVQNVNVIHQSLSRMSGTRRLQQGGTSGLVIDFAVAATLAPKNPPNYEFGVLVNQTLKIFALQFEEMLSQASLFFPNPNPSSAGIARSVNSTRSTSLTIYLSVAGGVVGMLVMIGLLGMWFRQRAANRLRHEQARLKRENTLVLGEFDWSVHPQLQTAVPTASKSASYPPI